MVEVAWHAVLLRRWPGLRILVRASNTINSETVRKDIVTISYSTPKDAFYSHQARRNSTI